MASTDVRPLETPRSAGVAGLAFALLFAASVLLLRDQPSDGATAEEIRDFYLGDRAGTVALVVVYLVPFAGIAFLWFIAVIRNLISDREDRFFATVFVGSGLLFARSPFSCRIATDRGRVKRRVAKLAGCPLVELRASSMEVLSWRNVSSVRR